MSRLRRVLTSAPIAAAALCGAYHRASAGDSCAVPCTQDGYYGPYRNGCGPGGCGRGGYGSDGQSFGDRVRNCAATGGGLFHRRIHAIPDTLPLGSTVRAHYHTMQTNAEASDFVMHRYDFVGFTPELSPAGRDHVVEIAARMKSAPFPVVVERSENNSDPELDARRRNLIAQILSDFGVPEANQRTFVSPAYGRNANSVEAQFDYYQFLYTRGGAGGYGNGGYGGAGGFGGGGGGVGF